MLDIKIILVVYLGLYDDYQGSITPKSLIRIVLLSQQADPKTWSKAVLPYK